MNRAWAEALYKIGIINSQEFAEITIVLEKIKSEFDRGEFGFLPEDEDIHCAIERRITELTEAGLKIHTGRSRNDQVMTDLLIFLKEKIRRIGSQVQDLQRVIIGLARDHDDLIMPGYTHLLPAQPILFAHYLLSFFWLLKRDQERLSQALNQCEIMPLGAGAISGSGLPVDRDLLAEQLGFKYVSQNSIDITSHRDIPTEAAFVLTMIMIHLSRYASDLIIFSNPRFGFIEIDDAYTTGSSIMPHKKNPDGLELIRGKAATAIGHLTGLLILGHGMPHGYNRDLQEDKVSLFPIIEITGMSLQVFTGVLKTMKINKTKIKEALDPVLLSTEIADYLVGKGIPFREAHKITGKIVRWAEQEGLRLDRIPLKKFQEFSPLIGEDIYQWLDLDHAIERRNLEGGTGRKSVNEQLNRAEEVT